MATARDAYRKVAVDTLPVIAELESKLAEAEKRAVAAEKKQK